MCDEATLTKIFEEFDTDKSGQIEIKELRNMVKAYYQLLEVEATEEMIKDTCYELMKNLDSDCDGSISLKEWLILRPQ